MFELGGKVALITGGSRGIGRAIGRALARQGAHVVLAFSSDEAAAAESLADVQQAGGSGEVVRLDVRDPEACDRVVTDIVTRSSRLDILVNNAGVARDQLLLRVKPEEIEDTFSVNVRGAISCAKAAIRPMMKARRGRIVNLSSIVAESGNAGQAVYSASKAALIGLTKTLAREYASRGVTVNAVAPGFIDTDMTSGISADAKEALIAQTPAGRMGTADDVAAAVAYLCSDEASFVTGHVLRVNGGMYV